MNGVSQQPILQRQKCLPAGGTIGRQILGQEQVYTWCWWWWWWWWYNLRSYKMCVNDTLRFENNKHVRFAG
jgi:hypothetical protein